MTLFRPGDWLIVAAGMALVAGLFTTLWGKGAGATLVIRSDGAVVAEADLTRDRDFSVPGPLGVTIVSIRDRRVRVSRDPGPRQYCVKQGWLSRAGESALCLPNHVSVELKGSASPYDSLSY